MIGWRLGPSPLGRRHAVGEIETDPRVADVRGSGKESDEFIGQIAMARIISF